jgi:hypothetical protein
MTDGEPCAKRAAETETTRVTIGRHIAAEILRDIASAFAVLALVFLSYVHQPINLEHALGHDVLTASLTADFCGEQTDEGKAHAPCHACRIGGGADVPAPPCAGIAAPIAVASVTYYGATVRSPIITALGSSRPRGPPALV